jgi:amino acid adenylation domain-containing protein
MNAATKVEADRAKGFAGPAELAQSIPERFAQVVSQHASRTAVSESSMEWTYAELDQRSSALAAEILDRLGTKSEPVVLLMRHGAALIAAIVAVLKAGKIYLVLDVSDSIDRLTRILADSRPRLLISDQSNAALADLLAAEQLPILRVVDRFPTPSTQTNFPEVSPEAGAWLMYTSGSTGTPKGVWQNHCGIVHDTNVCSELIQLTPDDRLSLLTSCSFAASGTALFCALLNGATLCPFHVRSQGVERLAIWLRKQGITIYHSVPTIFRHLVRATGDNEVFASLRLVRLGGEPVLSGDVEVFRERCHKDCRLMNALSSTETGLICAAMIDKHTILRNGRVPVGRAVRDVEVFLANEQGEPLENGSDGRIAVRSAYLRQGYWRQPEATAQKFVADPRESGTRIFMTNDLGRFLPDGNLEHLGRADRVVKIGGLRVDLAEVEAALRATGLFQEAAAITFEHPFDGCQLVTCAVPRPQTDCSSHACRQALQELLSVPSRFVVLQQLPLLANGKIDRTYLSKRIAETFVREKPPIDPVDAVELQLVRIWEKVLAVEAIATTDDFFALGGDSLAAATMLAAVEKFCGVDLRPSSLLEAPTIQKLAEVIRGGGLSETDLRLVALRLRGSKPPLYCVPGAGADALCFRNLSRYLSEDQPVFAFQPRGLDGRSPCLHSVEEMARSYIDAMRLHQPHGPYYLCGSSFGGVVAFEMARQLAAESEEVRFLALLGSYGRYPKRHRCLTLAKQVKVALLPFLPHDKRTLSVVFSFKGGIKRRIRRCLILKGGLKEWIRSRLIRCCIQLDTLLNFRALRCPYKLRAAYIRQVCLRARRHYDLKPFYGKIHLFRVENYPPSDLFEPDPLLGWSGMAAAGIEVHELPDLWWAGEMDTANLARKLSSCLEKASQNPSQATQTNSKLAILCSSLAR